MQRSALKRRSSRARYGPVRAVRCVVVSAGVPFMCPNCGGTFISIQTRTFRAYGRQCSKDETICSQCKYAVRYTAFEPRIHASLMEYERGEYLRDLQRRGDIWAYVEQVEVELPYLNKSGKWTADSTYVENDRRFYESVEGVSDTAHKVLERVWRDFGPGTLRIVRKKQKRQPKSNWRNGVVRFAMNPWDTEDVPGIKAVR